MESWLSMYLLNIGFVLLKYSYKFGFGSITSLTKKYLRYHFVYFPFWFYYDIFTWLSILERSANDHIVICPHWRNDTRSREIEDTVNTSFTRCMLDNGYVILPWIKNHNSDLEYPITFYKRLNSKINKGG